MVPDSALIRALECRHLSGPSSPAYSPLPRHLYAKPVITPCSVVRRDVPQFVVTQS